jgi:hypothetical protein
MFIGYALLLVAAISRLIRAATLIFGGGQSENHGR